jgi:hypothetical protein
MMTSLGLRGWLIQIVGVIVALTVATGRAARAGRGCSGHGVRS